MADLPTTTSPESDDRTVLLAILNEWRFDFPHANGVGIAVDAILAEGFKRPTCGWRWDLTEMVGAVPCDRFPDGAHRCAGTPHPVYGWHQCGCGSRAGVAAGSTTSHGDGNDG